VLHFVLHNRFLYAVISSPFHGSLEMTVIRESPSLACHCEEPDKATWQSPIKKRGDYFAEFSMSLLKGSQCH